jgi:hypothetical protein
MLRYVGVSRAAARLPRAKALRMARCAGAKVVAKCDL